jgi:hypothetical protein
MADQYLYELTDTWAAGTTSYNGIKLNVADAASAADSKLLNLQINGASKFTVDKAGNVVATGGMAVAGNLSENGSRVWTAATFLPANYTTTTALTPLLAAKLDRVLVNLGAGENLDTYTSGGDWHQATTANATLALNYPVAAVGFLSVRATAGASRVYQTYVTYLNDTWARTIVSGVPTPWIKLANAIHTHLLADLTDSTIAGRSIAGASSYSAMRSLLTLDAVNNTADLDKPVSTAQTAALALKLDKILVAIAPGENLNTFTATGDFHQNTASSATLAMNYPADGALGWLSVRATQAGTRVYQTYNTTAGDVWVRVILSGTPTAWVKLANAVHTHVMTDISDSTVAGRGILGASSNANIKTILGLDNVNNTLDSAKPVSTAQAAAIALRAPIVTGFTGAAIYTTYPSGISVSEVVDTEAPGFGTVLTNQIGGNRSSQTFVSKDGIVWTRGISGGVWQPWIRQADMKELTTVGGLAGYIFGTRQSAGAIVNSVYGTQYAGSTLGGAAGTLYGLTGTWVCLGGTTGTTSQYCQFQRIL